MILAIDIADGQGLSNRVHCELLSKKEQGNPVQTECFSYKANSPNRQIVWVAKLCLQY